nr:predicted GPI-anchored protein 58 [Aegilops tauschii subsp. strangulata]
MPAVGLCLRSSPRAASLACYRARALSPLALPAFPHSPFTAPPHPCPRLRDRLQRLSPATPLSRALAVADTRASPGRCAPPRTSPATSRDPLGPSALVGRRPAAPTRPRARAFGQAPTPAPARPIPARAVPTKPSVGH